ncbi:MAG: hypothetical protein V3W37_09475, partial [Candidatus Binatia bacterium]
LNGRRGADSYGYGDDRVPEKSPIWQLCGAGSRDSCGIEGTGNKDEQEALKSPDGKRLARGRTFVE